MKVKKSLISLVLALTLCSCNKEISGSWKTIMAPTFIKAVKEVDHKLFSQNPKHCPHSSPKNTGEAGYFLVLLKHGTRLQKCLFAKPNSEMLVRIKETGPFLGFLFHHSSSAIRKLKLLCTSQLLIFFSPYGKAEYQSRENT